MRVSVSLVDDAEVGARIIFNSLVDEGASGARVYCFIGRRFVKEMGGLFDHCSKTVKLASGGRSLTGRRRQKMRSGYSLIGRQTVNRRTGYSYWSTRGKDVRGSFSLVDDSESDARIVLSLVDEGGSGARVKRVLAIYQIMLGWKHIKSGIWATFSHGKYFFETYKKWHLGHFFPTEIFFAWVGIGFI